MKSKVGGQMGKTCLFSYYYDDERLLYGFWIRKNNVLIREKNVQVNILKIHSFKVCEVLKTEIKLIL